ncbi:hypothetical protein [Desulfonatronovibrio magnus]|uniref:hypothetical protein n=1 Tax=Desulfonatronovibrio magnus TaxID=698827 RepID=UPI0005EAEE44|nr:hypothetical protein [Desulfonatronovibrio magnus]
MEYTLYDGLLTGLAALLLGCAAGFPALALLSEAAGILRKKVFMHKFAQQYARIGLLFVYAVTLAVAAAWAASHYILDFFLPDISGFWIEYEIFWDFSLYLSVIASVLMSIYYFTWKALSKIKALHMTIGILANICATAFLILLGWAFYRELLILPEIAPDLNSIFLPLAAQAFLLSLAAAAVTGMLYLLLRRSRDDFGRDYYRFALAFGARWGIMFAALSPLTCLWLFMLMEDALTYDYIAIPGAVYSLSLIIMAIILWRISRSEQPMRNKLAIIICPLFIWLIFVARFVSYLEFTNMDQGEVVIHTFIRDWPLTFQDFKGIFPQVNFLPSGQ